MLFFWVLIGLSCLVLEQVWMVRQHDTSNQMNYLYLSFQQQNPLLSAAMHVHSATSSTSVTIYYVSHK